VAMDDFIDRIMSDPRLNANPAVDEAHHKVPYTGRSMAESHRHLNITPTERSCGPLSRAPTAIS
jgi:hemoglobin